MNKKTIALMAGTAIVGVLGTFLATLPSKKAEGAGMGIISVGNKEMEKCYGIAKAGKNDCADKLEIHTCSGKSVKDADRNEYMLVPKGTCEKIVGGSTE